jgi:hypothetical protein
MADPARAALRFFGVIDADEALPRDLPVEGLSLVHFRDLGAVVTPAEYVRVLLSDDDLEAYIRVVDELYRYGPIIPAPPGTVFRDGDVLLRWLELHYAKLHETLGVIERRGSPSPPYDMVRMELEG